MPTNHKMIWSTIAAEEKELQSRFSDCVEGYAPANTAIRQLSELVSKIDNFCNIDFDDISPCQMDIIFSLAKKLEDSSYRLNAKVNRDNYDRLLECLFRRDGVSDLFSDGSWSNNYFMDIRNQLVMIRPKESTEIIISQIIIIHKRDIQDCMKVIAREEINNLA